MSHNKFPVRFETFTITQCSEVFLDNQLDENGVTPLMESQTVSKPLDCNAILTWLITWEDVTEISQIRQVPYSWKGSVRKHQGRLSSNPSEERLNEEPHFTAQKKKGSAKCLVCHERNNRKEKLTTMFQYMYGCRLKRYWSFAIILWHIQATLDHPGKWWGERSRITQDNSKPVKTKAVRAWYKMDSM